MLMLALGCKGAEGPMGPQGATGPQGPEGEPGPGTRLVFVGQLDGNGAGGVSLPVEAGNLANPPVLSCYISSSLTSSAWLLISTSNLTGSCGLVWTGSNLHVGIVESAPFWYFRVVVVF